MAPAPTRAQLLASARLHRPSLALARVGLATARARREGPDTETMLRKMFPGDHRAEAILRATQSPLTTTDEGGGAELLQELAADFIGGLTSLSAAARLSALAVQAELDRAGAVRIPSASGATAHFVEEGGPIPVTMAEFDDARLEPRKLCALTVVTEELLKRSNAAQALDLLLREATARAMDAALFDSTAGDGARPAGLLHGVTPVSGFPGGDLVSVIEDVAALMAAVTPVSGAASAVLIASPARAARLGIKAPGLAVPVLASGGVPEDRLIAVVPQAVAIGTGGIAFESSKYAAVHMSDAALALVDSGTADPIRSMYQTGAVSLRLILETAWAKRHAAAVAYVEGTQW